MDSEVQAEAKATVDLFGVSEEGRKRASEKVGEIIRKRDSEALFWSLMYGHTNID